MLKAIIVDDEKWICQLIKKIIDWDSVGIDLIGQAEDGITALELITSKKPDIVITDIRMPGIDGLEIIKRTRDLELDTSFIIISGFKHFEYAHNAIKYGVEDYLLKPIKETELTNILLKIREKSERKMLRNKEEFQLKSELKYSNNLLREQFLEKIFSGAETIDSSDVEHINEEYHFTFKTGFFCIVKYMFDNKTKETVDESYKRLCIEKTQEITDATLKANYFDYQKIGRDTILINYDKSDCNRVKADIKNIFDKIAKFTSVANYCSFTISVGLGVASFRNLEKAYATADSAIKARIVEGQNRIIAFADLEYDEMELSDYFTEQDQRQLINIIEVLDQNSLEAFINTLFDKLSENDNLNPKIYFELAERVFLIFLNTIKSISSNTKIEYEKASSIDLLSCKSIDEIKSYVLMQIGQGLGDYLELFKSQTCAPVRAVKDYVIDNYNKNINLNQIAELVNLNPVYLSIIFKKEMGVNFSDYVINYRIDKAKVFLKDIKYNISQVSEMVGYSDPKYFSKLFRKKIGVNPTDYRKIHL